MSNVVRAIDIRPVTDSKGTTDVEIKIGVVDTPKELSIDTEESAEAISKTVQAAIKDGTLLALTDSRGRTFLVPAAKIAYVEIGPGTSRKVGFGQPA